MRIARLAGSGNLKLAWRRITTGGNHQYKRLYRNVYYTYEVALDANLRDLSQRLRGGTFKPTQPERIYVPKASGLHRPITLLNVEDQIVLQAFANLAAARMQRQRGPLQFKVVFSNILMKPSSIFFFRRWQDTYAVFQDRIREHYRDGLRWVGDFDLAAFYDTISHELLLRTIYPKASNEYLRWFTECLRTWSSGSAASGHGHGLPQGPIASDFLAECFLVPVDLALRSTLGYVRYVDDVRLFGKTEDDVRAKLISLERQCREHGLIPQTGKFAIRRATSLQDAMGMLPSISDPHHESGTEKIDQHAALWSLRSAMSGKPYRVIDKTRLRFVLYRAEPSSALMNLVLVLIPRHPEHADVFFAYLGQFGYRKPIERLCQSLVANSPYAYIRGEAGHVLARYRPLPISQVAKSPRSLTTRAIDIARLNTNERFAERWGACHFLCVSQSVTGNRYTRFLKRKPPLLQSLLAPVLPDGAFAKGEIVEYYLRQPSPEPGLAVCPALNERSATPLTFGVRLSELPSQVLNTLREMGVVSSRGGRIDTIAEILTSRFRLPSSKSWYRLLGAEYSHALGLLKQAEAAFSSGRSFWLACQNSFNQTIFLAVQRHLATAGHSAVCKVQDKNGNLIDFGVTLDAAGSFSIACPAVGDTFRSINARRNRLPASHPYEKKTAKQSRHLTKQEQRTFVEQLETVYPLFVALMP